MAMLAAVRRPPSARPEREAPPHATSVGGQELATRLRKLGASTASPEDALVPMLHAILEATGAVAGALCLYDVAQQVLRLAAEVGLTDAGCRQLRTITRGDADSWGMPLHGMLNRRCYLIENAAQNRFVPPLIAEADKVETVACLPLYNADTPLASLILITRSPRVLGERELHGVEAPVHEIARLIETMHQRALGREGKPAASPPVPRIGLASEGSVATPPPPGVPAADTARLAAELARAERERDRLAAALETLRHETRGNVETRAAALADLERLRTQVIEAEAAAADERATRAEEERRFADSAATGRRELLRAHEALDLAERARAAAIAETARLRADLDRLVTLWREHYDKVREACRALPLGNVHFLAPPEE
jgi:hypothetical protein